MGSIIAIGVWENKGTKGFNLKLLIKVLHRSAKLLGTLILHLLCLSQNLQLSYLHNLLSVAAPAVASHFSNHTCNTSLSTLYPYLLCPEWNMAKHLWRVSKLTSKHSHATPGLWWVGCNLDCGWRDFWTIDSPAGLLTKQAHVWWSRLCQQSTWPWDLDPHQHSTGSGAHWACSSPVHGRMLHLL